MNQQCRGVQTVAESGTAVLNECTLCFTGSDQCAVARVVSAGRTDSYQSTATKLYTKHP